MSSASDSLVREFGNLEVISTTKRSDRSHTTTHMSMNVTSMRVRPTSRPSVSRMKLTPNRTFI